MAAPVPNLERAELIAKAVENGLGVTEAAKAFGVDRQTVYRDIARVGGVERRSRIEGRAPVARASASSAVTERAKSPGTAAGKPWAPLCMTDEEWADWRGANPRGGLKHREIADRPCQDCPLGYAADMRAQGRCNGTPGGVEEDEEEPMAIADSMTADPRALARLPLATEPKRVERSVALSLPCHACIHREVCRIRESMSSLERLPVLLPQLDPALSVDVGATVDCSLFKPERGLKSRGGASRNVSPEALEAMRKNAAIMRGRRDGMSVDQFVDVIPAAPADVDRLEQAWAQLVSLQDGASHEGPLGQALDVVMPIVYRELVHAHAMFDRPARDGVLLEVAS